MKNEFVDRISEAVYNKGGFTKFADELGVHPSAVYRWMMGETKPDFESLDEIGQLGIDLNWLVSGQHSGQRKQNRRKR